MPIPLGPIIPTFSPLYIFKLTFLKTCCPSKYTAASATLNTSLPLLSFGVNFNLTFLLSTEGLSIFLILSKAFCLLNACFIFRLLPYAWRRRIISSCLSISFSYSSYCFIACSSSIFLLFTNSV